MKLHILLFLILLVLLPGCTPYHRWLSDVFYQGEKITRETAIVRQYFRAAHIYDQFSTVGHFDTLWLSDEVLTEYAKVYACKYCLSEECYATFLLEQLEETKNYISFYVLSALPSCYKGMLDDKNPEWAICMKIDEVIYRPIEIKMIELTPEFLLFFGHAYTRFKTPYLVRFNAYDNFGRPLITKKTDKIELLFSRPDRKAYLTWCLDAHGHVIHRNLAKITDTLQYDVQCCP